LLATQSQTFARIVKEANITAESQRTGWERVGIPLRQETGGSMKYVTNWLHGLRTNWLHGLRVERAIKAFILAPLIAAASMSAAMADDFPAKPVRLLVGIAPGGGTDAFARVIAQKLQAMWGQPVVVENKVGASGTIASTMVATSPPDGYTAIMANPNSQTIGPHIMKLSYDGLRDFTPITLVMEVPHVLVVSADSPFKTMRELVDYAKANPDKVSYYSSGIGSTQHLTGEMLNMAAGTKIIHVPYKGSGPAITDLIGGRVTMGFDPTTATLAFIKSGKLRALAIADSKRSPLLPDVPTTAEAGFPGIEMLTWYGLFGPKGMPPEVVAKWQRDVAKIVAMPDVHERIVTAGGVARGSTPEAFSKFIRDQYAAMGKLVSEAQVKAE
jgi:tripartite-type tricarboxylate transporter receptor subunit TctC